MDILTLNFPNKPFWKKFLEDYSTHKNYWYIPKGFTIKDESISSIKNKFRLLSRFFAQEWNLSTQKEYCQLLEEEGLIEKKKTNQSIQDYSALARIQAVVFDFLGLAYIEKDSLVYITDAGEKFLRVSKKEEEYHLLQSQLGKYQFYNIEDLSFVNPFVSFLKVIIEAGWVTEEEYLLFVNFIDNETEVKKALSMIFKWRKLELKYQQMLLEKIKTIYTIKGTTPIAVKKLSQKPRYKTIKQNYPYQKNALLFYYKDLIKEKNGTFKIIDEKKLVEIFERVEKEYHQFTFENKLDWYTFYGDPNKKPNAFELLRYKIEASHSEYKNIQEKHASLVQELSNEEKKNIENIIYEKDIENVYSQSLDLLESNLALVEKGRQYSTFIGRIDLLCKDKEGNYVVVEIKRGKAEDQVMGQILRYIGWVHQNLDSTGNTRGIILAESFPDKVKFARIGLLKDDSEEFIKFKEISQKVS